MAEERIEREPTDRLTRLCDTAVLALEASPEYRDGDKCIIMLDDGKRGGIVFHGYDDQYGGMTDLLMHLRAMFRASGKRMDLMFMDEDGTTRVNG